MGCRIVADFIAIVNIVVYADIVLRDNRDSVALPVIQKFATLFLALLMTATVLDTRSNQRKSPDKGMHPTGFASR